MILYCDSSALVKKYIKEDGSQKVCDLILKAEFVVVSMVGYAEIFSAVYRKRHAREISPNLFLNIQKAFEEDWQAFVKVHVNTEVNQLVKKLLSHFPLRGFDAIHIASAIFIQHELKQNIHFLSFDVKQNEAAEMQKLKIE